MNRRRAAICYGHLIPRQRGFFAQGVVLYSGRGGSGGVQRSRVCLPIWLWRDVFQSEVEINGIDSWLRVFWYFFTICSASSLMASLKESGSNTKAFPPQFMIQNRISWVPATSASKIIAPWTLWAAEMRMLPKRLSLESPAISLTRAVVEGISLLDNTIIQFALYIDEYAILSMHHLN